MRKFSILILSLFVSCLCYGQVKDTSSQKKANKKVYGIYTKTTVIKDLLINPDSLNQIDTGLTDVHQFDPVILRENHYTNLGTNVSPSIPLFFDFNRNSGFNFGLHQWDIYRLTDENIPYYNTHSPYTNFHYLQGPKELQYFDAIHSQNITPYWNFSVQYRKYTSTGFYAHQASDAYNFGINTWYRSKSRRYMVTVSAIWNQFQFQENGGLLNDSFLETKNANSDRISMPLNLGYANQTFKDQNYSLHQFYYFGKKDERKAHDSDSVATTFFFPRFYISHAIQIYNMRYAYFDSSADTKSPVFPGSFDTISTHDNYRFRDISNEIRFGQVEYHGPKELNIPLSILIHGYGKDDIILARYPGKDTTFRNDMIGGGIDIHSYFNVKGEAAYILYGYNIGDYNLAAKIEFPFKIAKHKNVLGFSALNKQAKPAFLDQTLFSNHASWNNDFHSSKYYEAGAFLYSDSLHYKLSARYDIVSSQVYYGYYAEPEQAKQDLHYFMINAEKDFKIGAFHFNNSLIYQKVLTASFIRLPDFSFRGSYFVEQSLFNNALVAQIGFDFRYNTSYDAYAYMPGISQFYLQDRVQIGNYPFFDAWISGRISRFRIFFKSEHVTQGLFGYRYYSTPSYAFYPRTILRIGLKWMFYN